MINQIPAEKTIEPAQRLFFALWPDEGVRQRLAEIAAAVGASNSGRLIPADNLHITLVFLGTLDNMRRQCAEQVAASIRGERFTLVLDQIGYWSRPRILWAGASRIPDALLGLAGELQAGLTSCGITPEDRPYQAHVTLMRKVNKHPALLVAPDPIAWDVERFWLVESVSGNNGVLYRPLVSWPLA